MVNLTINGFDVQVDEGTTVLEAARWMGINIPTLCYYEGLSPYGSCRLCVVEVGVGKRARLAASCTLPVQEGLAVRTHSQRVVRARKMLVELMLASFPNSKVIQDLAAKIGVERVRFKVEEEDCILCGRCVRMCAEQMGAAAIDFINRGARRKIATPFHQPSELCRGCGACMFVCPLVELPCRGAKYPGETCGSCLSLDPACLSSSADAMCYLDVCGHCVKDPSELSDT